MAYTVRKDGNNSELHISGKKLEDIFSEGALAVFHLLYDTDSIRETERLKIVVQAKDLSKLFHAWVTELLDRSHLHGLACGEFHVSSIQKINNSQYLLTGITYGETFDVKKHGSARVKSISKITIDTNASDGGYTGKATITFG